jgi:transposase
MTFQLSPEVPKFMAMTPEQKREVAGLVPPPGALPVVPFTAIGPGDPQILERIVALKAAQQRQKEEERHLHLHPPGPEDFPQKKRLKVDRKNLELLSTAFFYYGNTQSAEWYAAHSGIILGTVRGYLAKLRKGEEILERKKRGRKPIIENPFANSYIREALKVDHTMTLYELEDDLEGTECPASRSTIHRMLSEKREEPDTFPIWSFKRLVPRAAVANTPENKEKRKQFVIKLAEAYRQGRFIIYLDETSWNSTCVRKYGWATKGDKGLGMMPPSFISFTAITTISQDGIGYSEMIRGSITAEVFRSFILRMIPHLPEEVQCVIVMDNASIHDVDVEATLMDHGHNVLFNAAYSPELNPIEKVFGVWKGHAEARTKKWEGEARFIEVVEETLHAVSKSVVRSAIESVRNVVWPQVAEEKDL